MLAWDSDQALILSSKLRHLLLGVVCSANCIYSRNGNGRYDGQHTDLRAPNLLNLLRLFH